ncbi:ArsR family transcriptional regulator [Microtetraspora malaysiensis]|uniref:ArsR family transcriptional regulator n=1 Tax=Microtetraspora malaysiensis TaxID=161358 RepID=A0ABW6T162_9ACTN
MPVGRRRWRAGRYEETGPDGRRLHTVEQIATEFGVTRPTIYRHLAELPAEAD